MLHVFPTYFFTSTIHWYLYSLPRADDSRCGDGTLAPFVSEISLGHLESGTARPAAVPIFCAAPNIQEDFLFHILCLLASSI